MSILTLDKMGNRILGSRMFQLVQLFKTSSCSSNGQGRGWSNPRRKYQVGHRNYFTPSNSLFSRSPLREDPDERKIQEEKHFFMRLRKNLVRHGVDEDDILDFVKGRLLC